MKLTPAQWRLLGELTKPNRNTDNTWYFPAGKEITLQILARHSLAVCTEPMFHQRVGYRITNLGRKTYRKRGSP